MDELLLALLEPVLEIVGQALLEFVFGFAVEALQETVGALVAGALEYSVFKLGEKALSGLINLWSEGGPAFSAIGLALAGGAAGGLSTVLFPQRLIATHVALPGLSLLLAPLAAGYAMRLLGERLRDFGRSPSSLATFRGGALFAFSMALIRWWLVGLH